MTRAAATARADMTFPNLAPSAPALEPHALDVAGASERGAERARNEDHFVIADLGRYARVRATNFEHPRLRDVLEVPAATLMAVADGMGGHAGGDMASAVALDVLVGAVLRRLPDSAVDDVETRHSHLQRLARIALDAQRRLTWTAARKGVSDAHPGTTLTAALLYGRRGLFMHVGDSRAYVVRDGAATRLTHDHTVGEQLRARGHETGTRFDAMLVNAIGGSCEEPDPELLDVALEPGDAIALVTDGVSAQLGDDEIGPVVSQHGDEPGAAAAAAHALDRAALARGGTDDATAIVARVVRGAG